MIYFVSDVHLGFFDREKERERESRFIGWLRSIQSDCTELFLLGDIFDYWFEYKQVIPAHFYRTLSVLSDFVANGIKIEYLMGNHDFGHKTFFKEEFGINIIKTDIEREYAGKRFYISHGDGKAYNDFWYLVLRKILRNAVCQKLFSIIHPDIGIGFALWCSRKSRKFTADKNYGNTDGMHYFAKNKIEEGFDYVVMGHRHLIEQIAYKCNNSNKVGEYINLGSWFDVPTCARFNGEKLELISIKKNNEPKFVARCFIFVLLLFFH